VKEKKNLKIVMVKSEAILTNKCEKRELGIREEGTVT